MSVQIIECEQGTPEWFQARCGLVTASNFAAMMAKGEGKTRSKLMRRLAGEVITGEPTESYTNGFMERGKEMEAEARDWYAFTRGCEPRQIGFMVNGRMGYSPDSLVGDDGLLEIKTALPDIVIEAILRDEPGKDAFPPEHRAQCQGGLLVSERKWIDIVIYHPKMPRFVIRATPDNSYIATLRDEIARFNTDLDALVERIRRYEPRAA